MNFLNDNGEIDLTLVDSREYSGFKGEFIEDVDPHLAKLILKDDMMFKIPIMEYLETNGTWETHHKKDENGALMFEKNDDGTYVELPRFTPESKTLLKKRVRLLRNGKQLKILYHQKKGGLGRFYSHEDNSLTCLARNIRNTIYEYMGWVDYDFVSSHPTILSQLALKIRVLTPRLNEWVKDKKTIVKFLSDHHSVDGEPPLEKEHIKKLVCATPYGGGLETWACGIKQPDGTRKGGIIDGKPEKNEMPMKCKNYENCKKGHVWYKELKQEISKISKKLIGANPKIKERVARPDDPEWKKNNSTISYILGIFENECLYQAYQYGLNNELITPRRANLAYDGFTTPPPPPNTDYPSHLNAVNDFIFENTGFNMKMEVKPFDKCTIHEDLIDARKNMTIPDVPDETDDTVTCDNDVVIMDRNSNKDQEYLIWKERFERTHIKIINTASYFKRITTELPNGDEQFEKYKIFNRTELINAYEHESYTKIDPDTNRRKKIKFINEWIGDGNIRRKDDSKILPPPLHCPSNVLNLWKPSNYYGRNIEENNDKYDKTAVNMWLNHVKVMCDHDMSAYEYVINWFAHLLQKPAEKAPHLIITGQQGTGKTIALAPIKKIMGGGYFETTQPERDVWGNFNPLMATSLLVVLSECDKRNAYGAENKIKGLITDEEMTINDKGIQPFVIQSFHRFITPTNSFDPVKLEHDERRNMIIKMSDEFKKNWDYFKNFATTWDNEDSCLSLYSYLMDVDISNWNRWLIPHTEYHKQLVEFSRNPLDEFFEWFVGRACTEDLDVDDDGFITRYGSEIMTEFRLWREQFGGKYDVNGSGDLIKKITCGLNLPKGCLGKGQRTNKGARTKYHIENLKKHYKIGECLINVKDDDSDEEEI